MFSSQQQILQIILNQIFCKLQSFVLVLHKASGCFYFSKIVCLGPSLKSELGGKAPIILNKKGRNSD